MIPLPLLLSIGRDLGLDGKRSFRQDAIRYFTHNKTKLQVEGLENIPQSGPFVITINHYYRPGFRAQWLALAVSSQVPVDIHWIVTNELTFPNRWYGFIGRPVSRLILKRAARIYGFTTMPPMPPRSRDAQARAASVRAVLNFIRSNAAPIIGLAPEGGDQPHGIIRMPPSGLGRFALLLAEHGLQFLPVGIYEKDGSLCLNFGRRYALSVRDFATRDEVDLKASRTIMEHIAALLEEPLRGNFTSRPNAAMN
mgnify:CR=1 FL=1